MIGGDHSISLPILRALAKRHGPLALVQFDAHIDTWDEYFGGKYFHGTPFRRAIEEGLVDGKRFIQVGIRGPMYGEDDFDFHREHGITMIDIDQVKARGIAWTIEQIQRVVTGPAYMTFDIDSVDPAFAPGTGTPEVGGLTSHEAQQLVRGLGGICVHRRRHRRGRAAVRRSRPDHGAARRESDVRVSVRPRQGGCASRSVMADG